MAGLDDYLTRVPDSDPEGEHQDESVTPPDYQPQILGKAFTGGIYSQAEEDARREDGNPHR